MKIKDRLQMLCHEDFHISASNVTGIKLSAEAVGGGTGEAKLIMLLLDDTSSPT